MTRPRNWLTTALRLVAGIAIAVPAALLLGASPAAAHPMPHSVVQLDVYEDSVTARLELPAGDLATASGIDLTTIESSALPTEAKALRTYLAQHIRPTTLGGEAWQVDIGALDLGRTQQTSTGPYRELIAEAVLTPPAGADVRHFTFDYDVIVHQVITHTALVTVRQDWATGQVGDTGATQVGTIRVDTRTMKVPALTVDLGEGSAWRGFLAMVELGGDHILTGTDHLLFLLILLLPAPLAATAGRWSGLVGARSALGRTARITLAFTVGHSIALAATALGRLDIPDRPVESFIALSILIGAVHAIRPLFPGREAVVAGVFGLGHGMAFSFVLAEMHLSTGQLVTSLLGFNLGIELVQLLLVCLALPSLLLLARLRVQPVLRLAGALLTGTAALGWLADRLGLPNPVARAADSAGSHTTPMLAALTVTALATTAWTLATRRRARPGPAEQPAVTSPEREGRHTAPTRDPHDRDQSVDTADSATTLRG
ncbi:HupE/UreJ family protein [Streptomyces sp. WI04-05B]|uniref:HupE/UreJ family protein n=1 Tax=Streptomyces TaxID=1883 RepID=UPI0029B1302B|nr:MULTISPECIES: HupE/UreJ family protein [unclassified Streptomyces]MDX2545393.1 HupE/UreJ family protein [Streptomyces sp. WI04-05B]MDX2588112.1 HupE/UreJ family protein [Streptomyces sp. WI04-05A]